VRKVALRLTIDAARRYDLHDPLQATALSVALMRLPLPQRQVLVLYYLADLPVDDIARDRGIADSRPCR
jgi:DNA-directed RNA polymerase specialized sigma24 family protein